MDMVDVNPMPYLKDSGNDDCTHAYIDLQLLDFS